MNLRLASRLRQRIVMLCTARKGLEARLLRRRRMLRASLIERYLGTADHKRKSPAYYLSFLRAGKRGLSYVKQHDRLRIEPRTKAWSEYYHLLADWVKLHQQLEATWRALGQAQADEVSERAGDA
jgi:hypothetical protein